MGLMRSGLKSVTNSLMLFASLASLTACGGNPSFSLLADQNSFSQTPNITNGKIDILWVVDNSGSMASSQDNVAQNFKSFIDKFKEKNMDYRMAVITSDAYRSLFGASASISKFRDGTNDTGHTGVFVVTPDTPNLEETFLKNMIQGIAGNGDERAFQSISVALDHQVNAEFDFPREGAFLSVIIVSDEDDFSHDTATARGGQYSYSGLHTVDKYVEYFDQLTGTSGAGRMYNVNSIAILDQACLDLLNAEVPGRKIGIRYQELSQKTGGVIGSLCGNFGETLSSISNRIIELSTRFELNRVPNPDTIVVTVDGQSIPRDEANGWSYDANSNSIIFHGASVPAPGSTISVNFDPITIK